MKQILFATMFCLLACDNGDTAVSQYSGQTKKYVYTINPNTMRLITDPKDPQKPAKLTKIDSVYVSPEEMFVIAFKGEKPICTVFPHQDSASTKPPR